jgi:hypothetical protein
MNGKKAKAIRRIATGLSERYGYDAMRLIAHSPRNPRTAIVAPKTTRGLTKTIKRTVSRGR